MTRLLRTAVAGLALVAGAMVGSSAAAPAYADTGCVVFPLGDSAPVYASTSTSSAQIGTITYDKLGRGCRHSGGSAYTECGGGTGWVFVRNFQGYAPAACVETAE
jgi:hypothetical protein